VHHRSIAACCASWPALATAGARARTSCAWTVFLAAAERVAPLFAPIFLTLARTGLRIGEALALQWDDLTLAARELRVARAVSRGRLETPKSGLARTVDVSRELAAVLRRLQVTRKADALRRGSALPPWVFCTQAGHPY
jgi:integrase